MSRALYASSCRCTAVSADIDLFRRLGCLALPFDRFAAHVIGEPHRVGAEGGLAVGGDAGASAARRQSERVHRHRHAAGVAIADLDVAIDHHGGADKTHGAHADVVAEL